MTPDQIKTLTVGTIVRGPTLRNSDPVRSYRITYIHEDRTTAIGSNIAARTPITKAFRYLFTLDKMEIVS